MPTDPVFAQMYDRSTEFWNLLFNIQRQISGKKRSFAAQFWGSQMRFYKQMLMALKVSSLPWMLEQIWLFRPCSSCWLPHFVAAWCHRLCPCWVLSVATTLLFLRLLAAPPFTACCHCLCYCLLGWQAPSLGVPQTCDARCSCLLVSSRWPLKACSLLPLPVQMWQVSLIVTI